MESVHGVDISWMSKQTSHSSNSKGGQGGEGTTSNARPLHGSRDAVEHSLLSSNGC
jgi:hypothetical protein